MTADKEEVVDFVAPYYEQSGITIGKFHINLKKNIHRHAILFFAFLWHFDEP